MYDIAGKKMHKKSFEAFLVTSMAGQLSFEILRKGWHRPELQILREVPIRSDLSPWLCANDLLWVACRILFRR